MKEVTTVFKRIDGEVQCLHALDFPTMIKSGQVQPNTGFMHFGSDYRVEHWVDEEIPPSVGVTDFEGVLKAIDDWNWCRHHPDVYLRLYRIVNDELYEFEFTWHWHPDRPGEPGESELVFKWIS